MAGLKIFQIYQKNVTMKAVHKEIHDFFGKWDKVKKILQKLLLCIKELGNRKSKLQIYVS